MKYTSDDIPEPDRTIFLLKEDIKRLSSEGALKDAVVEAATKAKHSINEYAERISQPGNEAIRLNLFAVAYDLDVALSALVSEGQTP